MTWTFGVGDLARVARRPFDYQLSFEADWTEASVEKTEERAELERLGHYGRIEDE